MFHRVVPKSQKPRVHNTVNEITPEKLDELIGFYKQQNVHIISPDDIPLYLEEKLGYFVVFTFDDGYRDNLQEALPVFEAHQAPFTVYVATGFPERSITIWWYQLEDILLEHSKMAFKWNGEVHEFECTDKEQKEEVFNIIRRMIIDTPFFRQKENLETAFEEYEGDPFHLTGQLAMSWEEVAKMARSPLVTIGAHTASHPALNQLTMAGALEECQKSRELLEAKTDKSVGHFAYPFGSVREMGQRECDIVREIGFKTAVTTRTGSIFAQHGHHLHSLPRIAVTPGLTTRHLEDIINGTANFIRGSRQRIATV